MTRTLALVARTFIAKEHVLIQAKEQGQILWILLEGEALERARDTLLKRHQTVLAECKVLAPDLVNDDTIVMSNVRMGLDDTPIPNLPHTYRATSWSYATLHGWVNSGAPKTAPATKAYAHG